MTKITDKSTKSAYIRLSDGLAIRKVPQSKNWGIYLKFEGHKPLQFSLKTHLESDATKKAWEQYFLNKARLDNGELIHQPKIQLSLHEVIDQLITEYLKLQKIANTAKPKRKGLEKYSTEIRIWKRFKEFYNFDMKVNQLVTSEVRDYFLNLEAPSPTQLGRMKFCFRVIFERALEHKLIKLDQVVDLNKIKIEKRDIEDRDNFTSDEFHKLVFYALTEYKTSGKGIIHNKMCVFYAGFMYYAGLRSGDEMMGLKWSDLDVNRNNDLYCTVRKGKTEGSSKKNRNVILDLQPHGYLLFVAKLKHSQLIKGLNDNDALLLLSEKKADELIFSTKYSDRPNYRATFNNWLAELRKLNQISKTKNFVLYSFRHSYITNSIERNVPLTLIAENAGTSVKMIETYYSHTSVMNEVSRKYLVSDKLLTEKSYEIKELTVEDIEKQKDELIKFVELEFSK